MLSQGGWRKLNAVSAVVLKQTLQRVQADSDVAFHDLLLHHKSPHILYIGAFKGLRFHGLGCLYRTDGSLAYSVLFLFRARARSLCLSVSSLPFSDSLCLSLSLSLSVFSPLSLSLSLFPVFVPVSHRCVTCVRAQGSFRDGIMHGEGTLLNHQGDVLWKVLYVCMRERERERERY